MPTIGKLQLAFAIICMLMGIATIFFVQQLGVKVYQYSSEHGSQGRRFQSALSKFTAPMMLIGLGLIGGGSVAAILALRNQNNTSSQESLSEMLSLIQEDGADVSSSSENSLAKLKESIGRLKLEAIEARKRERSVIERAVDVICIVGMDSRFISVSKASENAWGYSAQELEGKPLTDIIVSDEATDILNSIVGSSKSIDKIVFECRLRKKDDSLIDVIWTGHWSATEGGLFCIVHDITERKRAEQMKQEFLAMVTHDIRTPLASIHGILVLLEDGVLGQLTEKGRTTISKVRASSNRLLRLINDLLDLEKINVGKFSLEFNQIGLRKAIDHAVDSVTSLADQKRISFEVNCANLSCWADDDRVVQVLINLFSNAIKFSPEHSSIKVLAEENDEEVKVSVVDQGRGIPAEKTGKIFDHFEQVSVTDATEKRGTGLGLAICRGIITEHGGKIGVTSEAGKGSTFWFTLPKQMIAD